MAKVARRKKAGAARRPAKRPRCKARTQAGRQCRNAAAPRSKFCATHKGWKPTKPKAKPKAKPKRKPKARAKARPRARRR